MKGPNQPKEKALLVLSCLKMGIYKTAVSKELKIRIEKIQDNLSNVKGRPQDADRRSLLHYDYRMNYTLRKEVRHERKRQE